MLRISNSFELFQAFTVAFVSELVPFHLFVSVSKRLFPKTNLKGALDDTCLRLSASSDLSEL